MKAYRIPLHNEDPSDEMVEWLHKMTQEWDGDESGITISPPGGDGEPKIGGPGDYVVEKDGVYYIVTAKEIENRDQIAIDLGVVP